MSSKEEKNGWSFNPRKSNHFVATVYRLSKIVPYVLSKHQPRVLELDTFSTVEGEQSEYEATQKLQKNEYEMLGLNCVVPKRVACKEFFNIPEEFDDIVSKEQSENTSSESSNDETNNLLDNFLNLVPSKLDENERDIVIHDTSPVDFQAQDGEPEVEEDEILYIGDTSLCNSKKKTHPPPSNSPDPGPSWIDATDISRPSHASFSGQSRQENVVSHAAPLPTAPQILVTNTYKLKRQTSCSASKENDFPIRMKKKNLNEYMHTDERINQNSLKNDKPGPLGQTKASLDMIDDSPQPKQLVNPTQSWQDHAGSSGIKVSHFTADATQNESPTLAGGKLARTQSNGTSRKSKGEGTVRYHVIQDKNTGIPDHYDASGADIHESSTPEQVADPPPSHLGQMSSSSTNSKNISIKSCLGIVSDCKKGVQSNMIKTSRKRNRKRQSTATVKDVITSKNFKDSASLSKGSKCSNSNLYQVKDQFSHPTSSDSTVKMCLRSSGKKVAKKQRPTAELAVVLNKIET